MRATAAEATVLPAGGHARPDGLADGIARLRRALRRGARVADPENPLAVAQLELLSALVENPASRPGQIAQLLHMRPNTVTTIVNALVAHGMVSRAGADGDRRAVELTATEAGREAVRVWQTTNAGVLHLALSTLTAQQRRALQDHPRSETGQAQLPARESVDASPEEPRLARVGREKPDGDAGEHRLAGTGATHHADRLARVGDQAHPAEDLAAAEALVDGA